MKGSTEQLNQMNAKKFIGTDAQRLALDTTGLPAFSEWIVTDGSGNIIDGYVWDGTAWNH